jgi:uncharacterized protein (TIGR03083 family)
MDRDEVWRHVAAERLSLAELLATLSDEDWNHPSLCTGWRVCDVVAHLALGTAVGPLRAGWEFARARGNVHRMIRETAIRRADSRNQSRLVADLRAAAISRRHPAGTSFLDPLSDVLVHGQDIAVPLGLTREAPLEAAAVAATRDYIMGFPFHAQRRLARLRLEATNVTWTVGDGPVVRGPILALLLVITGRPAGLTHLAGDGLADLTARLTAPPRPMG